MRLRHSLVSACTPSRRSHWQSKPGLSPCFHPSAPSRQLREGRWCNSRGPPAYAAWSCPLLLRVLDSGCSTSPVMGHFWSHPNSCLGGADSPTCDRQSQHMSVCCPWACLPRLPGRSSTPGVVFQRHRTLHPGRHGFAPEPWRPGL